MFFRLHAARASALALTLIIIGLAGPLFAQGFPAKTVRIVVPFPAGGAFDIAARIVTQRMAPGLGQNIVVENRPGGGTVVATDYVARAAADGYTVLMVGPSFAILPAIRSKLPFDPVKDFKAVAQVISLPVAIAVHPSLPARSLKELIALARARPGEIAYGTSGPGTVHHLLGEMFKIAAKIDLTHAPYQGGAPAVTAAVGGHITMLMVNVAEMGPFVKIGKLRGIVVTTPERAEAMPDVPTMREAGFPELEATNWSGFVVPSATSQAAVSRLNAETVRALGMAEVRESMRIQGMSPAPGTPERFAELIRTDAARYAKVVREAKVTVD
jgi:tripartite-type tricarboxylate transporter receptor subunit TctC